jgi:hypothetical protein
MVMFNFRNGTVALALALAVSAAAAPALAKQRVSHPGYAARAQAVPGEAGVGAEGMSGHRAQVLRECNDTAGKFTQYTWGNMSADQYRACMAQHGEAE